MEIAAVSVSTPPILWNFYASPTNFIPIFMHRPVGYVPSTPLVNARIPMDIASIVLMTLFFAITVGLALGCDKLRRPS
jgi:hypothetical protein